MKNKKKNMLYHVQPLYILSTPEHVFLDASFKT